MPDAIPQHYCAIDTSPAHFPNQFFLFSQLPSWMAARCLQPKQETWPSFCSNTLAVLAINLQQYFFVPTPTFWGLPMTSGKNFYQWNITNHCVFSLPVLCSADGTEGVDAKFFLELFTNCHQSPQKPQISSGL